ncbi:uncharacterized protein LOC143849743 [Tasmannia lanceolata]|uniref:uncharacterized protein LOC143849743 n=1 Tax=Tasmannia lanceolata TaxID=3420 RepID=UPI00406357FF
MNTHQSFRSSFTNSSDESESQNSDLGTWSSGSVPMEVGDQQKKLMVENLDGCIGVLQVYIHQARDIHNICIYQKQDVYAKVCLTSNPDVTVSTQIINGGGKNPVFNENLRLNVRTIDSSLKCEIWMLSRVKNYLEDQLLGFALVPLSEVVANGRLMQEFSLSSTDLFHSPAGFVQLSLYYSGSSPEVFAIAAPPSLVTKDTTLVDSETASVLPSEYSQIEFPDLNIVNENELMVSEYFGMPCTDLNSENSESLVTSDTGKHLSSDIGVHVVESFSEGSPDSLEVLKSDTPPSSVSTNGSPSAPFTVSSKSFCDPSGTSKSPSQDQASSEKEKNADIAEVETDSSSRLPNNNGVAQSIFNIKIEPEQPVVQQDIVDMYMKSMQQFTESLAKMKLPVDIENGSDNSENTNLSADKKLQASKSTGSRVFYGSRAFF